MAKNKTIKNTEDDQEVKKPKSDTPIRIVYLKDTTKEQYDVTDNSHASREGAIPVSASNYKPGAVNHKITIEDIEKYPALQGFALPGDIVDKAELDALAE